MEVHEDFFAALVAEYNRAPRPTFAGSYRVVVTIARRRGWSYPSESTARRKLAAQVAAVTRGRACRRGGYARAA